MWFFEWQLDLLRPGRLARGFESVVDDYVAVAGQFGRNQLFGSGKVSKDEYEQWFCAMWMFYQSRKKLQEYYGPRRLWSWRDLTIGASGNDTLIAKHDPRENEGYVLPTIRDVAGFRKFLARGREAAAASGETRPSELVPYSLVEEVGGAADVAADDNDIWLRVFSSLLGSRPNENPELPATRGAALTALDHPFTRRIWSWFCKRRDIKEYPEETLWNLFAATVFRDLAAQKKKPASLGMWEGGRLKPDKCRRVFVSLVSLSYEWVGIWHDAFCCQIEKELDQDVETGPLTDIEKTLFRRIHLANRYFANLPAALLSDRLWVLRPVLRELWQSEPDRPEDEIRRKIPDVLSTYGIMLDTRRQADRMRKQRGKPKFRPDHATDEAGEEFTLEDITMAREPTQYEPDQRELVDWLIDQHKPPATGCPAGTEHKWSLENFAPSDEPSEPLLLTYVCSKCRQKQQVPANDELKDLISGSSAE